MTSPSAKQVQQRLRALADPARAAGSLRYFKTGPGEYGEGDRFIGIAVPELRRLSREFSQLPLPELQRLLESPWHEERALALLIMVRQYQRSDAAARRSIYEMYLQNTPRINNWDLVDCSAEHIVGAHVLDRGRSALRRLAKSGSLWERRIAVLATFHYIKRGEFDETLRLARILISDREDLIHKAVGWMLREVGERNRAVGEHFLREHAAVMPRTMLRYAIEKFPIALRKRYMGMRS